MTAEGAVELLRGERDVFAAACKDFYNSPHGRAGSACPSPVWTCLFCPLAVFTPSQVPNLLRLRDHLDAQWKAARHRPVDAALRRRPGPPRPRHPGPVPRAGPRRRPRSRSTTARRERSLPGAGGRHRGRRERSIGVALTAAPVVDLRARPRRTGRPRCSASTTEQGFAPAPLRRRHLGPVRSRRPPRLPRRRCRSAWTGRRIVAPRVADLRQGGRPRPAGAPGRPRPAPGHRPASADAGRMILVRHLGPVAGLVRVAGGPWRRPPGRGDPGPLRRLAGGPAAGGPADCAGRGRGSALLRRLPRPAQRRRLPRRLLPVAAASPRPTVAAAPGRARTGPR